MSAQEYHDDDVGYLTWRKENPHGFVINIDRSYNLADAHLHKVHCISLISAIEQGLKLTEQYVKICGETRKEMTDWADANVRARIPDCQKCDPVPERDGGKCPTCNTVRPITGKCPDCD